MSILKIYSDGKLQQMATIRKFRIVQLEGERQVERSVDHYNLPMIIAMSFKVNNERMVQFRKWTNGIVKYYTIQGWVMDNDRLKNGGSILLSGLCGTSGWQTHFHDDGELGAVTEPFPRI